MARPLEVALLKDVPVMRKATGYREWLNGQVWMIQLADAKRGIKSLGNLQINVLRVAARWGVRCQTTISRDPSGDESKGVLYVQAINPVSPWKEGRVAKRKIDKALIRARQKRQASMKGIRKGAGFKTGYLAALEDVKAGKVGSGEMAATAAKELAEAKLPERGLGIGATARPGWADERE